MIFQKINQQITSLVNDAIQQKSDSRKKKSQILFSNNKNTQIYLCVTFNRSVIPH